MRSHTEGISGLNPCLHGFKQGDALVLGSVPSRFDSKGRKQGVLCRELQHLGMDGQPWQLLMCDANALRGYDCRAFFLCIILLCPFWEMCMPTSLFLAGRTILQRIKTDCKTSDLNALLDRALIEDCKEH